MSADATIGFDLPCEGCRYNLRGLKDGLRCPECGMAIDLQAMLWRRRKPSALHRSFRRINRLSSFDRFCMFLAVLLSIPLIVLGTVGLIEGFTVRVTLPTVLGVLPALAGWGILRAVYLAVRAGKRDTSDAPLNLSAIPSIYRDPIPGTTADVDAELERRAIETENEALLAQFLHPERAPQTRDESPNADGNQPTRSSGSA